MMVVVVVMSVVLLDIFACNGSGRATAVSHDLGFGISCQFRSQQGRSEAKDDRRKTTAEEEETMTRVW